MDPKGGEKERTFQTEGTSSVVRRGDAAEEGLELTLERDGARLGHVRHRGEDLSLAR